MLDNLLARNIFKLKWKKFGLWVALFSVFVITIMFSTVLKPYMDPLSIYGVFPLEIYEPIATSMCNFSDEKSDFCELDGDIRIQGSSSSIFFTLPQLANIKLKKYTWGIKLYARKEDRYVMGKVKEIWLKPVSFAQEMPLCTLNHSLPTIIFSSGGYAGNPFHGTTDVLIPLYLTSLRFNKEVQFLVQEKLSWWIKRHEVVLRSLSNYEIIDLDRDKDIRCFKNAVVGVKSHKEFGIDPLKYPYGLTLRNYTQFNRKIYSLEREIAIKINGKEDRQPRLLIISRTKTRRILNEDEVVAFAQRIGYIVQTIDAQMELKSLSTLVNSIDVMIGVHGAGLTNMVYLPENAILIQVVPLGLDSISKNFFEIPAKNMNIKYLEYKIIVDESSFIQQYPIKHQVITNPSLDKKDGWHHFRKIYLDNQDVRLDMTRFKVVLSKALEILHQ